MTVKSKVFLHNLYIMSQHFLYLFHMREQSHILAGILDQYLSVIIKHIIPVYILYNLQHN